MDGLNLINKGKNIDVMLLCEGTFPYVKGGVSTWIYQLITGIPEINFGAVFLGASQADYGGLQYEMPDNLVYLSSHFLFNDLAGESSRKNLFRKESRTLKKIDKKKFEYIEYFHDWFKSGRKDGMPEKLKELDFYLQFIYRNFFLYSKDSWEYMEGEYLEYFADSSFTDYFWTVRNVHWPIWKIAGIASTLPSHRITHSPSTGYAGFLGGILKFSKKTPFILTEHGIYIRERRIDILKSDMLYLKDAEHIKEIWINFFEGIGKFCYQSADKVISLFGDARKFQLSLGAPAEKTMIMPNGVDTLSLSPLISRRARIPCVVALIGRIVPIKDIKMFIKSIKLSLDLMPDIEGWIIGPEDEDPDYVRECKDLALLLGIEKKCLFLGFKNIRDVLPQVGLLTLTSLSEGMPLVVLEGFAAGLPSVCTDVGACRQLIYGGLDKEDEAIGKAGEIVSSATPKALSENYVEFLKNEKKWTSAQKAGVERVNKYYSMEKFLGGYREVYSSYVHF